MVAEAFPAAGTRLADVCVMGAPFANMSKLSLFKPDAIDDTGFAVGRHAASPTGLVRYPETDTLLNLHYKYMEFEYIRARHAMLRTGLGAVDIANRWGHRYSFDDAQLARDFQSFLARAVDITAVDPETHRLRRWWRPGAN
jgi:hypothetical protein